MVVSKWKYALLVSLILTALAHTAEGKNVFCHYVMGNTYGYTQTKFQTDINLAHAAGFDAFALDVGTDSWTFARVATFYAAAEAVGTTFKLFLSFDLDAGSWTNIAPIVGNISAYASHPNQFKYNSKVFVSTFGGESATMGYSTINAAWQQVKTDLTAKSISIFFVPEWSGLNANTVYSSNPVVDGIFSWVAWPGPAHNDSYLIQNYDDVYKSSAASAGKTYMAPLSPWFFTHLSYKNYMYVSEFLWLDRLNDLLNLKPDFIEVITWNDWGESHYIGPIDTVAGDLPAGASSYVTQSFTHEAFRAVLPYYITAYKNGQTSLTGISDTVIFWYRPNFKADIASNDPYGEPAIYTESEANSGDTPSQELSDNIFVFALLQSAGTITIKSGTTTTSFTNLAAGVHRIQMAFSTGEQTVSLVRGTTTILTGTGAVSVAHSTTAYNFNVCVGQATPP